MSSTADSGGFGDDDGDRKKDDRPKSANPPSLKKFVLKRRILTTLSDKCTNYIIRVMRNGDNFDFALSGFPDIAGTTSFELTNETDDPIAVRIECWPQLERNDVENLTKQLSTLNPFNMPRNQPNIIVVLQDDMDPEERIDVHLDYFGRVTSKNENRGETSALFFKEIAGEIIMDGTITLNGPMEEPPEL